MKRHFFLFLALSFLLLMVPFGITRFASYKDSASASYVPPETVSVLSTETGTITEIPLEKLVCKMLLQTPTEDMPTEALQAQAVAARSYILNKILSAPHNEAMLCDAECCMGTVLPSDPATSTIISEAVEKTDGEYLAYQGFPIKACYFCVSSGQTESSYDVWGKEFPYLTSVSSSDDVRAAKFHSRVIYPLSCFQTVLQGTGKVRLSAFPIGDTERTAVGHVKRVFLYGTAFTGEEVKGLFHLNSTNFEISLSDDKVIFSVTGDGHGVGMSLFGAKIMAEFGSGYQEILAHYYPNSAFITPNG